MGITLACVALIMAGCGSTTGDGSVKSKNPDSFLASKDHFPSGSVVMTWTSNVGSFGIHVNFTGPMQANLSLSGKGWTRFDGNVVELSKPFSGNCSEVPYVWGPDKKSVVFGAVCAEELVAAFNQELPYWIELAPISLPWDGTHIVKPAFEALFRPVPEELTAWTPIGSGAVKADEFLAVAGSKDFGKILLTLEFKGASKMEFSATATVGSRNFRSIAPAMEYHLSRLDPRTGLATLKIGHPQVMFFAGFLTGLRRDMGAQAPENMLTDLPMMLEYSPEHRTLTTTHFGKPLTFTLHPAHLL